MTQVTKQLRLRFIDSNDCIVSFTINPPAEPVNLENVEALMDLILSSNAFFTYTGGNIIAKYDVLFITEEIETIADLQQE